MSRKIIIAIDGFSSCGKSTLAKDLAKKLNYSYVDTGAMYRAVTYYIQENNIDCAYEELIDKALEDIHIDFEYDENGKQITILNGKNIEKEIRQPKVSDMVSQVSTIKHVRDYLVRQQQRLGKRKGIVMDGRDIGTVVFPHAELKIFLTADEEIRLERRYIELKNAGMELPREAVRENLKKRDYIDSHRKESPLRKADDAIVLDNTNLSQAEQVGWVLTNVLEIVNSHA
jgi:CMP/dCMP kinase